MVEKVDESAVELARALLLLKPMGEASVELKGAVPL
jgi:hypothetical protein